MSDVELLRQAAAKMRELAHAATPGPWHHNGHVVDMGIPPTAPYAVCHSDARPNGSPDTAEHIAAWHPGVALAVADLLDKAAAAHVQDEDTSVVWTDCPMAAAAVAIARAYLGGGR